VTTALRLGTRRSALALAQSAAVASQLSAALGRPVELVEIVTEGDRSAAAISQLGGTGVFVTALREALLDGRVDLAVHSLKDLPTTPAPGIALAAVPLREDPRDALVCPAGFSLGELSPGARIGTGSARRTAQLHALGFGFDIVPVRGNVDTRIRQAEQGEVDAVILARAGLARLDRLADITEVLDPLQMLPAPGQGALAVECRESDESLRREIEAALDDPPSRMAVAAERGLLAGLQAGCTAPVGALADTVEPDPDDAPGSAVDGVGEIYLRGVIASIDGSRLLRLSATGSPREPEALGRRLALDLLDAGAAELVELVRTNT
jgi:hydroxymethylbilane synthase